MYVYIHICIHKYTYIIYTHGAFDYFVTLVSRGERGRGAERKREADGQRDTETERQRSAERQSPDRLIVFCS